jgi:hypothetical protein
MSRRLAVLLVGRRPNAIASEIASEAGLDGTLIVPVGARLGAWSDRTGDERLTQLVANATASDAGKADA